MPHGTGGYIKGLDCAMTGYPDKPSGFGRVYREDTMTDKNDTIRKQLDNFYAWLLRKLDAIAWAESHGIDPTPYYEGMGYKLIAVEYGFYPET